MDAAVLGVILAGGKNLRYGDHKALEEVGGRRIIDRVIEAARGAVREVVIVANDPLSYGTLGLDLRPDRRSGLGALGGVLSGVTWARDRGRQAALIVACDMPFLRAALLKEIVSRAELDAVCLPASRGPRGVEPLCAAYGVGCLEAIEDSLRRGERAIVPALANIRQIVIPLETVERIGDPNLLFMNVNRPSDREAAEVLLSAEVDPTRPDGSDRPGSAP